MAEKEAPLASFAPEPTPRKFGCYDACACKPCYDDEVGPDLVVVTQVEVCTQSRDQAGANEEDLPVQDLDIEVANEGSARENTLALDCPDHSLDFDIVVQRNNFGREKLGVDVCCKEDSEAMLIGQLAAGPVQRWNDARPNGSFDVVRPGDRIVALDGAGGSAKGIIERMQARSAAPSTRITLRRRMEFSAELELREGEALGIDVESSIPDCLVIARVRRGPVQELNDRSSGDVEVRPGDRIVAVNGAEGDCAALKQALTSASLRRLQFQVRRMPVGIMPSVEVDSPSRCGSPVLPDVST